MHASALKQTFRYTIKVKPVVYAASDDLRSLGVGERQCRYMREVPADSVFRYYTQRTCEFECRMKYT